MLRDLSAAGHDPVAVRFFLLAGAHYRARLRLSTEALHSAAEQVRRLREFAERVRRSAPGETDDPDFLRRIDEVRTGYRGALDEDLNLPQGIRLGFELAGEANAALDAGNGGAPGCAGRRARGGWSGSTRLPGWGTIRDSMSSAAWFVSRSSPPSAWT